MTLPQTNTFHVVYIPGDDIFKCNNCGQTYKPALPAPITVFVETGRAFVKLHKDCKPSTNIDNQDRQDKSA
jgi:rubredoxin